MAGQRIQTVVLPETARTIEEGLRSLRSPAAEPVVRLRDLFSRSGLKYLVFEAQGARNGPKVLTVGQMVLAPPSGSKPFWENDDVAVYEAGQLF